MTIVPGILESSFDAISERVEEVVQNAKLVQVDVCDGLYVQSKTWPYSGMTTGRIEENFYIKQLMTEEMGLPFWDKVEYQFDLMIKDPWRNMALWAQIGGTSVVIHPTSCESTEKVITAIELAQSFLMDVYISYTYDEWKSADTKELTDILAHPGVKGLQCMTIKHIGVQGQKFDERWTESFSQIKKDFPHLKLQLDGGINEDEETDVRGSMADTIVIGSAIFAEGNPTENMLFYKDLLY